MTSIPADRSAREYVQLLKARVSSFCSLHPDDRGLPACTDGSGTIWVVRRCLGAGGHREQKDAYLLANDPDAVRPLRLLKGGLIELALRIRKVHERSEIASYRILVTELSEKPNGVTSLRFECPEGKPAQGWDDQLGDNPAHPWAHLHINPCMSGKANDLRLPTRRLCPILILCAFDHWYCRTYMPPV